jgi:hypothetical protein
LPTEGFCKLFRANIDHKAVRNRISNRSRGLGLNYHQTHTESYIFVENPETKKFAQIFCKAFFIFLKLFCLLHPGLVSFKIKWLFWCTSIEDRVNSL